MIKRRSAGSEDAKSGAPPEKSACSAHKQRRSSERLPAGRPGTQGTPVGAQADIEMAGISSVAQRQRAQLIAEQAYESSPSRRIETPQAEVVLVRRLQPDKDTDTQTPKRSWDDTSPSSVQRKTPPKRCRAAREPNCLHIITELGKILDEVLSDVKDNQVRHITVAMKTKLATLKDLQTTISKGLKATSGEKEQDPEIGDRTGRIQPTRRSKPRRSGTRPSAKKAKKSAARDPQEQQQLRSQQPTLEAPSTSKGAAREGPEREENPWGTVTRSRQKPTRTRPDAVVVTAKRKPYSEIFAMVTRRDDDQLSGLGSCVSKVRRTNNGNLLLEVAKGSNNAESMKVSMAQVLCGEVDVRSSSEESKGLVLEIRDLDALTRKSDIAAALENQYDFDEGKVKVRSIRPGYSESQIAVISLPLTLGKVVIKGGEVRIGWTICRIKKRGCLPRCYRCLETGHIASKCESRIDRSGCCFKCEEQGHKAAQCSNKSRYVVCAAAGRKDTSHQAGTKNCPSRTSDGAGLADADRARSRGRGGDPKRAIQDSNQQGVDIKPHRQSCYLVVRPGSNVLSSDVCGRSNVVVGGDFNAWTHCLLDTIGKVFEKVIVTRLVAR
ncbi:uncharacterized protein [Drosophila takahashii]|uniref:uncharacterized protein n=1 Tax=Drosophila takahashii TaxID=29030 RepID=UPI0038990E16